MNVRAIKKIPTLSNRLINKTRQAVCQSRREAATEKVQLFLRPEITQNGLKSNREQELHFFRDLKVVAIIHFCFNL